MYQNTVVKELFLCAKNYKIIIRAIHKSLCITDPPDKSRLNFTCPGKHFAFLNPKNYVPKDQWSAGLALSFCTTCPFHQTSDPRVFLISNSKFFLSRTTGQVLLQSPDDTYSSSWPFTCIHRAFMEKVQPPIRYNSFSEQMHWTHDNHSKTTALHTILHHYDCTKLSELYNINHLYGTHKSRNYHELYPRVSSIWYNTNVSIKYISARRTNTKIDRLLLAYFTCIRMFHSTGGISNQHALSHKHILSVIL